MNHSGSMPASGLWSLVLILANMFGFLVQWPTLSTLGPRPPMVSRLGGHPSGEPRAGNLS